MTVYTLNRKYVTLWRIRLFGISLFLCLTALWFLHFSYIFLFTALPIIIAALVLAFWYIPAFYKSYGLEITNTAITVKSGVIVKSTRIMPLIRTIYVTSYSTPVSRLFGIYGLTLRAARGVLITPEFSKEICIAVERAVKGEN